MGGKTERIKKKLKIIKANEKSLFFYLIQKENGGQKKLEKKKGSIKELMEILKGVE